MGRARVQKAMATVHDLLFAYKCTLKGRMVPCWAPFLLFLEKKNQPVTSALFKVERRCPPQGRCSVNLAEVLERVPIGVRMLDSWIVWCRATRQGKTGLGPTLVPAPRLALWMAEGRPKISGGGRKPQQVQTC